MRTTILPLLCLLAACGPSEVEVAEAQRAKTAAEAGGVGAGEAPVDLGEGLILTVLARGPGEFVPTGGRVRVHYTADVVAIADPEPEPEGEGDSEAEAEAEATNDAESETPTEEAPAAEETQEGAADAAEADADAPAEPEAVAEPEAAPSETEAADAEPSEALAEGPTLPLRFDSSRARGVPDVWDLSRTAKPRLIEGLRRGLVGMTVGTRATLYVPAALAWGEEGLPSGKVPPRADVLYEIELFEVLP